MPFSPAAMIVGANAIRGAVSKMKMHTADPGVGGLANLTTAGVQTFAWGAATADGDFDVSAAVNFTGGAATGPATWCSVWDTTGTIWYGNFIMTGDQTFNSAGQYTVTSLSQNGAAA